MRLSQEDPLEKEIANHSSILAWRIPWTEELGCSFWGHKESDMTEQLTLYYFQLPVAQLIDSSPLPPAPNPIHNHCSANIQQLV